MFNNFPKAKVIDDLGKLLVYSEKKECLNKVKTKDQKLDIRVITDKSAWFS